MSGAAPDSQDADSAPDGDPDIAALMAGMARSARAAAGVLARAAGATRDAALTHAAAALRARTEDLARANAADMDAARAAGLGAAALDRLALDPARIETMAAGLTAVAAQPDPLAGVLESRQRPNGLIIEKIAVPLGVIGVIFEARPNVTADAAALAIKSGNAAILRAGRESHRSAAVIGAAIGAGLAEAELPAEAVQIVPTPDRRAVAEMLAMEGALDVLIPRGGRSLVARVRAESRVPVFAHLEGVCHLYLHPSADIGMAARVVHNAKMRRPGICGALECLLVDAGALDSHLAPILAPLIEAGCEVRGDDAIRARAPRALAATEADWGREYLDAVLAVRAVPDMDAALDHIARHGTHHTDGILAADEAAARRFLDSVDSGIVMHNASTQFADGGEFGLGAEIGISTGKLHARGPVGARELTSYKYRVRGEGQCRPP